MSRGDVAPCRCVDFGPILSPVPKLRLLPAALATRRALQFACLAPWSAASWPLAATAQDAPGAETQAAPRPGRRDRDAEPRRRRSTSRRRSTASTATPMRDGRPQVNISESLGGVPGPARARSPELRAGRADLGARLRRPLDLRHPRRAPVRRRHPRDHARRPGPDLQRRPRLAPTASRCCAGRSRRCTATRRAACCRCSPRTARAARRRRSALAAAATARCASTAG